MERMKDLTQQYVEQLENMVIDLREEKFELEEENKMLKGELERIKKELEGAKNSGEEFAYKRADVKEENKKLKSDLEECECSFGFENDEVGYRKREYKRLKKWIKDHCKGYGNLFPEDEMKRQWKKADKKRK